MKREIVESGFGGIEIPFVFRNQILKKNLLLSIVYFSQSFIQIFPYVQLNILELNYLDTWSNFIKIFGSIWHDVLKW